MTNDPTMLLSNMLTKALFSFSCEKFLGTITLSFIFDNYCLTID